MLKSILVNAIIVIVYAILWVLCLWFVLPDRWRFWYPWAILSVHIIPALCFAIAHILYKKYQRKKIQEQEQIEKEQEVERKKQEFLAAKAEYDQSVQELQKPMVFLYYWIVGDAQPLMAYKGTNLRYMNFLNISPFLEEKGDVGLKNKVAEIVQAVLQSLNTYSPVTKNIPFYVIDNGSKVCKFFKEALYTLDALEDRGDMPIKVFKSKDFRMDTLLDDLVLTHEIGGIVVEMLESKHKESQEPMVMMTACLFKNKELAFSQNQEERTKVSFDLPTELRPHWHHEQLLSTTRNIWQNLEEEDIEKFCRRRGLVDVYRSYETVLNSGDLFEFENAIATAKSYAGQWDFVYTEDGIVSQHKYSYYDIEWTLHNIDTKKQVDKIIELADIFQRHKMDLNVITQSVAVYQDPILSYLTPVLAYEIVLYTICMCQRTGVLMLQQKKEKDKAALCARVVSFIPPHDN